MAGREIQVPGTLYQVPWPAVAAETGREGALRIEAGEELTGELRARGLTVSVDDLTGTVSVHFEGPAQKPGQMMPDKWTRNALPDDYILVLEYGDGPPAVVLSDEQGALLIEHNRDEEDTSESAKPNGEAK